jgi:hypothetical protein
MMVNFPRHRFRALRDLAKLEKIEAERFDLREDAEHRGTIFKPAGEHSFVALQLRHHRGEGGQSGSSEPIPDPDPVKARRCGHGMIVLPDLVSWLRRNLVIAQGDTGAISAMSARAGLRGAAARVRVERRQSDHPHRALHTRCGCEC